MNSTNPIAKDPGSFRDPSGFVFFDQEQVYRAVDGEPWKVLGELHQSGLLDELIESGSVVGSTLIDELSNEHSRLKGLVPEFDHFVRHERISIISYPYEWSFSMLADAAILHLELQKELLGKGYSLKDATAFNVQFDWARPKFIDLPSIEKPKREDVWIAYNQFCMMFLYPLLLMAHKGVSLKNVFLADLAGVDVDQTRSIFGGMRSLQPDLFLDVYLPWKLSRRDIEKMKAMRGKLEEKKRDAKAQLLNLGRLEKKITKLRNRRKLQGIWSDYATNNTYTSEAASEKGQFIDAFMKNARPSSVLDIGCNTGTYSLIASKNGARVISIDYAEDCIDRLYRIARREKLDILPLVVDISMPSPGMGYRNRERAPFLERVNADAVFALALMHHLLVTARIPLVGIRDLFFDLSNEFLVIEYVDREDEMFQTLLALREDIYLDLSLSRFLSVFGERFEIIHQQPLSGSRRSLVTLRKKSIGNNGS